MRAIQCMVLCKNDRGTNGKKLCIIVFMDFDIVMRTLRMFYYIVVIYVSLNFFSLKFEVLVAFLQNLLPL